MLVENLSGKVSRDAVVVVVVVVVVVIIAC